MTVSGIGYHILHDKMTPEQRATLLRHLRVIQPATVNVAGAESYPASLDYVSQILEACPRTLVFERRIAKPNNQGGDEGIWETDLGDWYRWRIVPYRSVLSHPRVIVLYDNESMKDDLLPYARQMVAAMRLADEDTIALGVGRFATGNPGEAQYAQLDPMWRYLAGSRHWWTPNEYAGPTAVSSAGHLVRYRWGWDRCAFLGLARPRTAIGEANVLALTAAGKLDAYKGRKTLGWSEEMVADQLIYNFAQWYQDDGVPLAVFAPEAQYDDTWQDMLVGEAFYAQIEARMGEIQLPEDWAEPVKGDGPMDYQEIKAVVINTPSVRVRQEPTTASAQVGSIVTGDTIGVHPPVQGQRLEGIGDLWIPVRLAVGGVQGYAHAFYLQIEGNTPAPCVESEIRASMRSAALKLVERLRIEVEGL